MHSTTLVRTSVGVMRLCVYIYINLRDTAQPEHSPRRARRHDWPWHIAMGLSLGQVFSCFSMGQGFHTVSRGMFEGTRVEKVETWPWERLDRGGQLAMRHESRKE